MALKKNPYVTPLAVPLAIACWLYTGTLMSAYDVRGKYLTAEMAMHLDNDTVGDLDGAQKQVSFAAAAETRLLIPTPYAPPRADTWVYAEAIAIDEGGRQGTPTESVVPGGNVYSAYLHDLVRVHGTEHHPGCSSVTGVARADGAGPRMCPYVTRDTLVAARDPGRGGQC